MFKRRCYVCQRVTKRRDRRYYYNDRGKRIVICKQCVEYAEERAFRKQ